MIWGWEMSGKLRAAWVLFVVAVAMLAVGVGPAAAKLAPAEAVEQLTPRDALNRTENPLSNGGKWAPLQWSGDSPAAGLDTTTGWRPDDPFPTVSGAYWTTPFEVPAGASATLATSTGIEERQQALWIDMSAPGTTESGYELSWTYVSSTSYSVKLSKWVAGTQTTLETVSATIAVGSTVAIADEGSTVRGWVGSGGTFTSLIAATDSTFQTGYAGIQGSGNNGRLTEFKAGPLQEKSHEEELASLTVRDPLNRAETPLSDGSKWAALQWANDSPTAGVDTTTGWRPNGAFPTVAGAYWSTSLAQPATAAVTMAVSTGIEERQQALWLDMSAPGTTKSGYELSWTYLSSSSYAVELSKWVAGTQVELASVSMPIAVGATLAISDEGPSLSAWVGSGGTWEAILVASDNAYSSGYAGIQGTGNVGRLTEFRTGR